MTPLPHNARDLTDWLRKRYPEVLEEYETEKNEEWEKKVHGPFSKKPTEVPKQNTLTRVSYLNKNSQVYKFEEFSSPQPKKIQPIPTDDDYRDLIYLAEEMDLDEGVIKEMKKVKNKIQKGA